VTALTSVADGKLQTPYAKIVAALISSNNVKEAAKVAGVTPQKIHDLRRNDPAFREMLEAADEIATNRLIEDAIGNVRLRVKDLGTQATEVLADSLASHDERVRLQAASKVLQLAGVVEKAQPTKKETGGGIDPGSRD
jgi:hypothetical protein